ncbi:hypothetical protein EVAR_9335_1 [Eumeta japonica]|uniref:Uncharacterized protein n=1 Tax=Eumeta variegata TaxID=151549 RepID=A0A4C1YUJ7_EUMVA|nr:hypothetical protein EVAR_9335_1 [Eumeta japonica]
MNGAEPVTGGGARAGRARRGFDSGCQKPAGAQCQGREADSAPSITRHRLLKERQRTATSDTSCWGIFESCRSAARVLGARQLTDSYLDEWTVRT